MDYFVGMMVALVVLLVAAAVNDATLGEVCRILGRAREMVRCVVRCVSGK
jgi:hypothetical protein